ncbi:MAG: class I SAM-dependent methyltransferase [Lyngbya sp. HA4199-MV5]|jgi:ubiquinone/menaquinone biosynthesis C-methylase UbiE|nr:class I SAM-dependent methyltransferase [Lyngbya sp. HA4199-MV5]
MTTHQALIIDQFTQQAIPFTQVPAHSNAESLHLLSQMANLTDEDDVLDVACGSGIVACAFAPMVHHVTGIDLTPAMLEQAQIMARQSGSTNLTWQQGDIEALPFADASFSLVLSRYAFHHFLHPEAVLAEMIRVCRPQGRILIADVVLPPEKVEAYNELEKLRDPSHTCALTLEAFQALFSQTELHTIRLAFYKVEIPLEQQLAASFPKPGDKERIRQLVHDDLGIDRFGISANLQNDEVWYEIPISIIVAEK